MIYKNCFVLSKNLDGAGVLKALVKLVFGYEVLKICIRRVEKEGVLYDE